jgi:hypothetical protein
MTFLGTRLYGVRNICECSTDRMTSQIVISDSSHFLRTANWIVWKSQKTDCNFAKFFNDFEIRGSQTDNNHNSSFLWYDALSTEELICLQEASTIRTSKYKDLGLPKQFSVCGERVSWELRTEMWNCREGTWTLAAADGQYLQLSKLSHCCCILLPTQRV